MSLRKQNRKFGKFILIPNLIFIVIISFSSCIEEEICTKRVNIPIWNQQEQVFEDNFQELPCDI